MTKSILDSIDCVYITSYWGWSPETWGTVGFTQSGRRDTIVHDTTDPFIMVIYVTKSAKTRQPYVDGYVTGFYLVSHIQGHRDEFTARSHHDRDKESWIYSLKALRAFSFLPEYRLTIDQFDPTIATRALSIAKHSEVVKSRLVEKLRKIPYAEVPVYGGNDFIVGDIVIPRLAKNMVKAGPPNRSGYEVPGEPRDTEKELYVLSMSGDMTAYLGKPAGASVIFKIGLSLSPTVRLESFRRSMPTGEFRWNLYRSTRHDGDSPYPCFEAAEAGERAMKHYLAMHANWLGGEFYAATKSVIDSAWSIGRKAALKWRPSS